MAFSSVLTGLVKAYAGMPFGLNMPKTESFVNAEASAEIPEGVVVQDTTTDGEAKLLTATNNKLIGIVMRSDSYAKDHERGTTGLKPKTVMKVATKGELYVLTEEAVSPRSAVLVRCVATGGEQAGAFRDTADSSDCVDISQFARYKETTTGAGPALLEFDFTMRGADIAD